MSNLNSSLPISLKHIQHIIDNVHHRYPLIEKHQVALIILTFFQSIREVLINNDILSLNGFFSNMKLHHFSKIHKNKFVRIVKVKLSTAGKLK